MTLTLTINWFSVTSRSISCHLFHLFTDNLTSILFFFCVSVNRDLNLQCRRRISVPGGSAVCCQDLKIPNKYRMSTTTTQERSPCNCWMIHIKHCVWLAKLFTTENIHSPCSKLAAQGRSLHFYHRWGGGGRGKFWWERNLAFILISAWHRHSLLLTPELIMT